MMADMLRIPASEIAQHVGDGERNRRAQVQAHAAPVLQGASMAMRRSSPGLGPGGASRIAFSCLRMDNRDTHCCEACGCCQYTAGIGHAGAGDFCVCGCQWVSCWVHCMLNGLLKLAGRASLAASPSPPGSLRVGACAGRCVAADRVVAEPGLWQVEAGEVMPHEPMKASFNCCRPN